MKILFLFFLSLTSFSQTELNNKFTHLKIFEGKIIDVIQKDSYLGFPNFIQIKLKTKNQNMIFDIAPAFYLEKNNLNLSKGQAIKIWAKENNPQTFNFISIRISRDSQKELNLRDEKGTPLWKESP